MPSKFTLSQRHKAKETKKLTMGNLASVIENALRNTLNTVKWSSNLSPTPPFALVFDGPDGSVLYQNIKVSSNQWSRFALDRTLSHTRFDGKYLVTTYKKLPDNNNWVQVYKIADSKNNVYFENITKQKLFKNLELCNSDFVRNNIQARNERSGNCSILAHALYYFLWNQAIKSRDNMINRIEVVHFKSLGHCLVVVNRDLNSLLSDYTTWNGWIIDPWRGINGKAFILHSDDFFSYAAALRYSRADIIYPDSSTSLEVTVFLSITDIKQPENIALFNKLDDLIHHGKMKIATENPYNQINLAIHKALFFAVKKDIELLKPKDSTEYRCQIL